MHMPGGLLKKNKVKFFLCWNIMSYYECQTRLTKPIWSALSEEDCILTFIKLNVGI